MVDSAYPEIGQVVSVRKKKYVVTDIQDNSRLFISSANLTESAFERNIELGVLISDEKLIMNLKNYIVYLIRKNVLVNITNKEFCD